MPESDQPPQNIQRPDNQPLVPDPSQGVPIPPELRGDAERFGVGNHGLLVPNDMGLQISETDLSSLELPKGPPSTIALPSSEQILQLAQGSSDASVRSFDVVQLADASNFPKRFIKNLVREKLELSHGSFPEATYDEVISLFTADQIPEHFWTPAMVERPKQRKKIGDKWIEISSPSPFEMVGMVVVEASQSPDIQRVLSHHGKEDEVVSHMLLRKYGEMLINYRVGDPANVRTIEMPDFAKTVAREVMGYRKQKERYMCYDLCEQVVVPLGEKEDLLWSMDRDSTGRDLRHPLAFVMTTELAAHRKDSPWVQEQERRRQELLGVLETTPVQELFDGYDHILKLSDHIVSAGNLLEENGGKIGMEIEFIPYNHTDPKYKIDDYVDPNLAKLVPDGFELGRDVLDNNELRRTNSPKDLKFDTAYNQSIGALHPLFKDITAGIAGFHIHLDKDTHPFRPNPADLFYVMRGEGGYIRFNDMHDTWEVRGLFPPVDPRDPHSIDPAVIADMVGFHIDLARENHDRYVPLRQIDLDSGKNYSLKELSWGYILNLTDSPQARLSAIHTMRHPYLWNTVNPIVFFQQHGIGAKDTILSAYRESPHRPQWQTGFLLNCESSAGDIYFPLWTLQSGLSGSYHSKDFFINQDGLDSLAGMLGSDTLDVIWRDNLMNFITENYPDYLLAPKLFEIIQNPMLPSDLRSQCVDSLHDSSYQDRLSLLLSLAKHDDLDLNVQINAVNKLQYYRDEPEVQQFLSDILDKHKQVSPYVLREAIIVLQQTENPRLIKKLFNYTGSSIPKYVREAAIATLCTRETTEIVDHLYGLLDDPSIEYGMLRGIILSFGKVSSQTGADHLRYLMQPEHSLQPLVPKTSRLLAVASSMTLLNSSHNQFLDRYEGEIVENFRNVVQTEIIPDSMIHEFLPHMVALNVSEEIDVLNTMMSYVKDTRVRVGIVEKIATIRSSAITETLKKIALNSDNELSVRVRAIRGIFVDGHFNNSDDLTAELLTFLRDPDVERDIGMHALDSLQYKKRREMIDAAFLNLVKDKTVSSLYRSRAVANISNRLYTEARLTDVFLDVIKDTNDSLSVRSDIVYRLTRNLDNDLADKLYTLLGTPGDEKLSLEIVTGFTSSNNFVYQSNYLFFVVSDPTLSLELKSRAIEGLARKYHYNPGVQESLQTVISGLPERDVLMQIYRSLRRG